MSRRESQDDRSRGERKIDERLLDGGERSPDSMESAAEEGFIEDQQDPEHPSRRQRELDREHGIENPAHSKGI